MLKFTSPCAGQNGQALVETLVVSVALIAMAVLGALLGRYQDIKRQTIAASRNVAFECTVRLECANDPASFDRKTSDEVRRRFFSGRAEIYTAERLPDDVATAPRNPLWHDRTGKPLLEKYSDVSVETSSVAFKPAGAFGQVGSILGSVVNVGPELFGLHPSRGLMSATVRTRVSPDQRARDFSTQLDSLALTFTNHTAILTDSWPASGPSAVLDRIRKPVRQGIWDALDVAYLPVRAELLLLRGLGMEPRAGQFTAFSDHDRDFIDPDVVPLDRLGR